MTENINSLNPYKGNTYEGLISPRGHQENHILVFGSNTEGRHGAGTAKFAVENFGAIYGQSSGLQGRSWAIITKDLTKTKHPSVDKKFIIYQMNVLYKFAEERPDLIFLIAYTATGKNLNGYTPEEIADMFYSAINLESKIGLFEAIGYIPKNIIFEKQFYKLVNEGRN